MSKANVEFLTLTGEPCPDDRIPQRFTFRCVKRNRTPRARSAKCANLLIANSGHGIPRDGQGRNGGSPQWDWDGNRQEPTFKPSINCEAACGWHGFIKKGRCVSTNNTDEPD